MNMAALCRRQTETKPATRLRGRRLSLVYPMRGEVTNRDLLGRKRHGRPDTRIWSQRWELGGSKLGGLKIIE
jgi:hypothetical protein